MNPKVQKNLLFILIPSTVVIVVWIIVGIYTKAVSSTISKKLNVSIREIDPEFNTAVITSLKKRNPVNGKIDIDPIATPSASPSPVSRRAPTPLPTTITPTSTQSGVQNL